MAEIYGCCSKRVECSDQGQCVYIGDPEFEKCWYRRNLEAGRVFYGKNAGDHFGQANKKVAIERKSNVEQGNSKEFSQELLERFKEHQIFLVGKNYPYAIRRLSRGLSYSLSKEQMERLSKLFENLGVPYTTDTSTIEPDIPKEDEEDLKEVKEICNSRVVISLGEEKYGLTNWNYYLIPEEQAKKIAKAFEKKGIESGVETYRSRPFEPPNRPMATVNVRLVGAEVPKKVEERKVTYEQVSLFSMAI